MDDSFHQHYSNKFIRKSFLGKYNGTEWLAGRLDLEEGGNNTLSTSVCKRQCVKKLHNLMLSFVVRKNSFTKLK